MPASSSLIWPLLRPPADAPGRRIAIAGVAGIWIGPRSLGYYVTLLGAIAVCTVVGSNLRQSASAVDAPEERLDVSVGSSKSGGVASVRA